MPKDSTTKTIIPLNLAIDHEPVGRRELVNLDSVAQPVAKLSVKERDPENH